MMGITSYAQNFEDVILWRALGHVERGCYVDIGAQDPVFDSVSRAFYERGWRGIHVEPTERYAAMLRADRPDEKVVQAAVAQAPGVLQFYEIPGTGLSTGSKEIAEGHRSAGGFEVKQTLVTSVTLDDVLALCPGEIHWLKIDVEGFERPVLEGWCAERRPWVVVLEATQPGTQIPSYEDWEPLLLAKDYACVYCDGINRYYLSDAQAVLRDRFAAPPNVFDAFQVAGSSHLTLSVAAERAEERARMESEKAKLREQLGSAAGRIQALEGEMTARDQVFATIIGKLTSELTEKTGQAQIERLQRVLDERLREHSEALEQAAFAREEAIAEQRRQSEKLHREHEFELREALRQSHADAEERLGAEARDLRATLAATREQCALLQCQAAGHAGVRLMLGRRLTAIQSHWAWKATRWLYGGALDDANPHEEISLHAATATVDRTPAQGTSTPPAASTFLTNPKIPFMTLEDFLTLQREAFLHAAYHVILGREPDAKGVEHYLSRLRRGSGKPAVLLDLSMSREADMLGPHRDLLPLGEEAFVNAVYRRLLGRSPDAEGSRHFLAVIGKRGGRRKMLRDVQLSEEAFQRDPKACTFHRELEAVLLEERKARHWSGWAARSARSRRTLLLISDRLDELSARVNVLGERISTNTAAPVTATPARNLAHLPAAPNSARSVFELASWLDTSEPTKFFEGLAKAIAVSLEASDLHRAAR